MKLIIIDWLNYKFVTLLLQKTSPNLQKYSSILILINTRNTMRLVCVRVCVCVCVCVCVWNFPCFFFTFTISMLLNCANSAFNYYWNGTTAICTVSYSVWPHCQRFCKGMFGYNTKLENYGRDYDRRMSLNNTWLWHCCRHFDKDVPQKEHLKWNWNYKI